MAVFAALIASPAAAQSDDFNANLDISDEPICFAIVNTADYSVNGSFVTEKFERPDGIIASHRSNFRLQPAGEKEDDGRLSDRAEFCSYGPFFEGRMLILTLRSLFPIFECRTRVDTGLEIVIKGARRADDTGVQTWAECFKADGSKTERPPE